MCIAILHSNLESPCMLYVLRVSLTQRPHTVYCKITHGNNDVKRPSARCPAVSVWLTIAADSYLRCIYSSPIVQCATAKYEFRLKFSITCSRHIMGHMRRVSVRDCVPNGLNLFSGNSVHEMQLYYVPFNRGFLAPC